MLPGMRRVPAERARHAKRLGHAIPAPVLLANAGTSSSSQSQQSATTATSQTTSPASSSAQSSSSSPPSSSSAPSSSHAPSSTTGSSTSSAAAPTTTQSLVPTSSSQSTVIQQITVTPSSISSPSSVPQSTTSHGLSGGALAGIIAGSVIVGVALMVFLVRKTYLRRRETKRISWNGTPGLGADFLDEPKPIPDIDEPSSSPVGTPQRSTPLSPFEARSRPMYSTPPPPVQHPAMPPYAIPTPPSATYNNPAYPTQSYPLTYNPGNPAPYPMAYGAAGMSSTLHTAGPQRPPVEAIVKCSFVPTLPDELSITTGERIFVVEQYDDGWDLCMNGRGDRGMVPRECLEHPPSDQLDAGWKNVRRLSSLNPDGRRF